MGMEFLLVAWGMTVIHILTWILTSCIPKHSAYGHSGHLLKGIREFLEQQLAKETRVTKVILAIRESRVLMALLVQKEVPETKAIRVIPELMVLLDR